jgi:hypothetical protein
MSYELKDYLNSINFSKEYLMDEQDPQWEKKYAPFIINKCMSSHIDTIMFANEMNINHQLPSKLQYDFFINIVRKRKRFSPWIKKEKIQDLDAVKSYYGYSNEKAQQSLKILTKEQIAFIKQKLDVGGKR